MNIMMLLEMAAGANPDRIAFVNDGESLTYQQLLDGAGIASHFIQSSGCQRFCTLDVSTLATPIGLFAACWAGVPYVPINYRLTRPEIDSLLARVKPAYLIINEDQDFAFDSSDDGIIQLRDDFLNAAESGHESTASWSMEPEDVAVLLFTSGTSGPPKAAVLRQKHLVSYILGSVEFASADESETALVCVPPYHIAGVAAILSSVYSGRRVVQLSNFSAEAWIDLARTEKVTTAFVVPTMLSRIVEALEDAPSADMPHLESLSYGGGRMPLPVIARAMELFPDTDFTNAYGLTETSSTVTVLGPEDHRIAAASKDDVGHHRLVSVGKPLPGIEIEIRDDEGNALGEEEHGEIFVRGEQVSGEYEGIGVTTTEDGWFPTKDAGYVDSEGYLYLEGRTDDIIVRGGENMSPGEIEDVIIEHPAVLDACVVGIPSKQWGETVATAVIRREGEDLSDEALQQWIREHMRSSRVPEVIDWVTELPYTDTGKLIRRIVREKLRTLSGESED